MKVVRKAPFAVNSVMMSFTPQVPTDSYHKFRALLGIWIIGASIVIPGVFGYYLSERLFDLQRDMGLLTLDRDALVEDIREDQSQMKDIDRELSELGRKFSTMNANGHVQLGDINIAHEQLKGIESLQASHESARAALKQRRRQLAQIIVRLSTEVQRGKSATTSIRQWLWFAIVPILYGFLLARRGLMAWSRIQRIEDDILLKRLDPEVAHIAGGPTEPPSRKPGPARTEDTPAGDERVGFATSAEVSVASNTTV